MTFTRVKRLAERKGWTFSNNKSYKLYTPEGDLVEADNLEDAYFKILTGSTCTKARMEDRYNKLINDYLNGLIEDEVKRRLKEERHDY